MPLSSKQTQFCEEYLKDSNATQAAIRTGYSMRNASNTAHKLMANPAVKEHINELRRQHKRKQAVYTDFIINGLREIYQRSMQQRPLTRWNPSTKCSEQVVVIDEHGYETQVYTFDAYGALRALQMMDKYIAAESIDVPEPHPYSRSEMVAAYANELSARYNADKTSNPEETLRRDIENGTFKAIADK